MNDLREQLYLIADELRGMATLGRTFAANVYETERAHRIMELAAGVGALAEGRARDEVRLEFAAEPWHRATPAAGVDALVLDGAGRILLVRRKDNGRWAMPGGIAEIGLSPAESALKELWEEAGLRGRATRLLGVFDGRHWGSRAKVHMVHFVFHVACDDLSPAHGIEMLDARFFAPDALPAEIHHGHDRRIARCLEALRDGTTHFDPADSREGELPMFQRRAGAPALRPPHLIAIGGATATGKTAAAIAVARRFDGEIVSADSRLVYRGLDIGTAKPTAAELAAAPHHLIDILDPDDEFSLAGYVTLARGAIDGILGRGRLPILAGGTPLYLNAVMEGWRVPHAPPDPALRAALEAEATRDGLVALEARLAAVDPVAAARAAGNPRRIVRALEVYLTTGMPMSAQEGKEPPPYRTHRFVLTLDRAALHARIDARVERMIAAGLVDEVRGLLERGYGPELPSMSGIGYAEIVAYLRGEGALPEAVARIKFNTHRYVRHQETWFRRNREATRIDVGQEGWLGRLIDGVGTILAGTAN